MNTDILIYTKESPNKGNVPEHMESDREIIARGEKKPMSDCKNDFKCVLPLIHFSWVVKFL